MEVILNNSKEEMKKVVLSFKNNIKKIRTGRANPMSLYGILVNYYGTPTPIEQIANISAPEARQIVIKPYEPNSIKEIINSLSIFNKDLDPKVDERIIRIIIPQTTEETRKNSVKELHVISEEFKVKIRNVRRHANEEITKHKKISKDDLHYYHDEIQKTTDKYINEILQIAKEKEETILSI